MFDFPLAAPLAFITCILFIGIIFSLGYRKGRNSVSDDLIHRLSKTHTYLKMLRKLQVKALKDEKLFSEAMGKTAKPGQEDFELIDFMKTLSNGTDMIAENMIEMLALCDQIDLFLTEMEKEEECG